MVSFKSFAKSKSGTSRPMFGELGLKSIPFSESFSGPFSPLLDFFMMDVDVDLVLIDMLEDLGDLLICLFRRCIAIIKTITSQEKTMTKTIKNGTEVKMTNL